MAMSKACMIAVATLAVFAVLAIVVPGTALAGKEEKIAVKDLPKVIVDTVNALFPGGKILEAEKETETKGGKTIIEYEVEVKPKEGKVVEVEFTMTPDGKKIKKIEIEEEDDDEDDDDDDDDDKGEI